MPGEKVIVDCTTGEIARGPLSEEEESQIREDARLHNERMKEKDVEEGKKENLLHKLASLVDAPIDDVKKALGVGRPVVTDKGAGRGRP